MTSMFKQIVVTHLKERFKLFDHSPYTISARQIASFLDPRYKDLENETIETKENIQKQIKILLAETASQETNEESGVSSQIHKDGLAFLYGNDIRNDNDNLRQYDRYLRSHN